MRIIKCDRCKKEIASEAEVFNVFAEKGNAMSAENIGGEYCEECIKKLEQFLSGEPVEKVMLNEEVQVVVEDKECVLVAAVDKPQPKALTEQILEYVKQGKDNAWIAKEVSCDEGYVENICTIFKETVEKDSALVSSTNMDKHSLREEVIKLLEEGLSNKEIASKLGCTANYVGGIKYQLKVGKPKSGNVNEGPSRKDMVIKLIKEGKTNKEIVEELKCDSQYVSTVRYQYKKSCCTKTAISDSSETSVDAEKVVDVKKEITQEGKKLDLGKARALLAAGWSLQRIAREELHCTVEELKDALDSQRGR